jgi:1-acyl-sn-glycerol-3-phosphate acyltransferase
MLAILRIFLLGLSLLIFTPLGLILCLIRPFNPTNLYIFACTWGPISHKILGFKAVFTNKENIESNRPCVYIMNHQTNFDIVIGGIIRSPRMVSLGKKEILWFPIFGLFYWLSGNILIKREKRHKALKAMEKVKEAIKNKNLSILIMPEGTRSKGAGLGAFKKGAFRTAVAAQVPVVPICVSNWHQCINLNKWDSGTLYINVLAPIPTQGLNAKDINQLTQNARNLMDKELDRLNSL